MFIFLLSVRSVKENEMICTLGEGQTPYNQKSGLIAFNCNNILEGELVKAKFGEYVENIDQYTLNVARKKGTNNFEVSYSELKSAYSKVTLAVINENSIAKYSQVDVTILPKPILSEIICTDLAKPIYPATDVEFKATITNTIMSEHPKIKYAFYDASQDRNSFENLEQFETSFIYFEDNVYTFVVSIPEDIEVKDYKLIAQFEDAADQNSDFASTKEKFTVITRKCECSIINETNHFSVDSKEVQIKCVVVGGHYSKIKAKVGKMTYNVADYTFDCVYDKESQILTCDFHGNTVETKQISLALISYENTIIEKTSIKLFLISAPVVSNLALVNPPARIYRGDTLEFKVTITKPTVSKLLGIVQFADEILLELSSTYEAVRLYRHAENSTEFRFEFTVPVGTYNGVHQLLFQVLTLNAERSQIMPFQINVVNKPKLECRVDGNRYLRSHGKLNLYCDVSEELKPMTFKIGLDKKPFYGDETLNNGKLSFEYEKQETEVRYVYVAAYQGKTKIVSELTDAEIYPSPNISKVVDYSESSNYSVGDIINLEVTIDKFYDINNAEIFYAFVDHKDDEVVNWIKSYERPMMHQHSYSLFLLSITVPESEKNGGYRFIKLKFTDEAKQSCISTTESPVLLRRTVFILDSKLGHVDQNSTEITRYRKDDKIKLTFKLSNLMDDWEDNIKFGYTFSDYSGNLIFTKSFDVTELKTTNEENGVEKTLEFSINIVFPYDFEIPKSRKTKLYVHTLDKNQNLISPVIVHEIIFENIQKTLNYVVKKVDDNLSGGAIASIVISVLVFVVLSVVGIYFFIRKRIWECSCEQKY